MLWHACQIWNTRLQETTSEVGIPLDGKCDILFSVLRERFRGDAQPLLFLYLLFINAKPAVFFSTVGIIYGMLVLPSIEKYGRTKRSTSLVQAEAAVFVNVNTNVNVNANVNVNVNANASPFLSHCSCVGSLTLLLFVSETKLYVSTFYSRGFENDLRKTLARPQASTDTSRYRNVTDQRMSAVRLPFRRAGLLFWKDQAASRPSLAIVVSLTAERVSSYARKL